MKLGPIHSLFITTSLLTLSMMNAVFAEDVEIVGSLQQSLKESNTLSARSDKSSDKVIQLLKVKLSEEERTLLAQKVKQTQASSKTISVQNVNANQEDLPQSVQLGMNKVPVLDQGMHGSCVTFAVTGAIDALLAKGDYISQLCQLQLGSYLEKNGHGPSGWNGSYPINVINQIEQYGIINTKNQKSKGCGGLTRYPTRQTHDANSFMEPEQFATMSEFLFGTQVNWFDVYEKSSSEKTLDEVKEALHSGDRLAFAVLLPRIDLGVVGAVGKYKTWFDKDSWVLTPEIIDGLKTVEAAHEMIITGYDDNAVATDNMGKKHKGLLKLRNSWGNAVGNNGEFYMSYDYFKLLSYDVKRFSKP